MASLNPARQPDGRRRGPLVAGTLGALLLGAAVVVNQSAVHWRENVVDSHLFAYYGWCVAHGARPYLDVWDNKPPGIWWLNALGFVAFGEGIGGEVAVSAAALLAGLVLFAALARTAYGARLTWPAILLGGVLLTHLGFECGANRTETFVIPAETLAILGYWRWWQGGSVSWLIIGGLAAGAAPCFKQSGLAAGLACALHLAWTQWRGRCGRGVEGPRGGEEEMARRRGGWRPWLAAGGGALLVPMIVGGALLRDGALGEAWFALGTFNQAYFAIGDASWWRIDRALATYREFIRPLTWLFAAVTVGAAWGWWRRRAGGEPGLALLWLWFFGALYLACVGPGRRGHHFMPVLPALGLLALQPLHLLARREGALAGVVKPLAWLAARPTAAAVAVLYGYALVLLAAGNAHEVRRCWRVKPRWYALEYAAPPAYMQQAATIARLTAPDEPIYVWGWSPGTYRYAYRRSASRFATLEKLGQVGEHAAFILRQAGDDVRQVAPRVFVASTRDLRGLLTNPADPLGPWLTRHYDDLGPVAGMHILLRRPPDEATRQPGNGGVQISGPTVGFTPEWAPHRTVRLSGKGL